VAAAHRGQRDPHDDPLARAPLRPRAEGRRGADLRTPDDPEEAAIATDRRARLLEAVQALPEGERQAVVCRYFLQLSEAETAEVLGCPLGSVKSRTFRGLAKLRKEVGRELS
jgi:RNA polymerase sigma factor (sigma-70 family)